MIGPADLLQLPPAPHIKGNININTPCMMLIAEVTNI